VLTFDPTNPLLLRLDAHLATEITSVALSLSAGARRQFLSVLANPRIGVPYAPVLEHGDMMGLGTANGRVVTTPTGEILLAINRLALGHPLARITLRHEVSHLSRLVTGSSDPDVVLARIDELMSRRLGIYREEIAAYRDDYRFIRATHTLDDLASLLRTLHRVNADEVRLLKQARVLSFAANGAPHVDWTIAVLREELLKVTLRYTERDLNELYIDAVRNALTLSLPAYLRLNVKPYQHVQHEHLELLRELAAGSGP
jgi:hypothetical protein